jgi:hypothetical protein
VGRRLRSLAALRARIAARVRRTPDEHLAARNGAHAAAPALEAPAQPVPSSGTPTVESRPADSLETALPRVLKIVGSVIAPTTLLTGLLFYFGRLHVTGFFGYLRVNFTVLNLTVQDYLIRSADGLFVPFTIAAAGVLVAVWGHGVVMVTLSPSSRRRLLRVAAPVAAGLGLLLVGLSMAAVLGYGTFFDAHPETGGLSLALGTLLLTYAARLFRALLAVRRGVPVGSFATFAVAEWGAAFVLLSVGLFWAVGSYAIGVGTGRAEQTEAGLETWPNAVLYSEKSLILTGPGVREVRCRGSDLQYRFRYDGLKLIFQSGEQYLFLPAGWTHDNGTAILLPRSGTLRLEFSGAGQPVADTC